MAKLNEIRFFLLVSLMIFPTRAIMLFLGNYKGDITEVDIDVDQIRFRPDSCIHYWTNENTTRVILYVVSAARFNEIMNSKLRTKRMQVNEELSKGAIKSELFYLAIEDLYVFRWHADDQFSKFILKTIEPPISYRQSKFEFRVIGNVLKRTAITFSPSSSSSTSVVTEFGMYQETSQVFDGKLQEHLDAIKL